jgi:oligopeptide/dipeptide ABC transporter ATP-binding protein
MVQSSNDLLLVHELDVEIRQTAKTIHPLQNANLRVKQNTMVGLVGESGSGKSMTAMAILRLLPRQAQVTHGQISYDGQDLLQVSDSEMDRLRGDQISVVFQNAQSSLNPVLSVGSQIADVYRLHEGGSKQNARKLAVEMLDAMGIPNAENKAHEYPHQYSGGMAQRAMIAMALVCSPRLLIADEPTSGLDVTIQAQVLDLIVSRVRQQQASLLLISHDMGVIAETCEEVIVMYAGTVMEYGTAQQVIHNPANPYSYGLMSAFSRQDGDRMYYIPGQVPQLTQKHRGCPFVDRCEYKTECCKTERPTLSEMAGGRYVACHHPLV